MDPNRSRVALNSQVTWRETVVPFEKRMDKYRKYQFLPQHLEVRLTHLPHCE